MIVDDKQQAFVSMPQAARTEIKMSLTASTKSLIATPRQQRVEEYWVTMGFGCTAYCYFRIALLL